MAVTASTLSAAMKVHYIPRLRNQMKNSLIFLKICQQAEQHQMTGQSVIAKMKIGNTAGITNPSASGGTFPTATASTYLETTIPLARVLGTIQVPREEILRAKGNAASLIQPLSSEVSDMFYQMRRNYNWNFFRDVNNTLATVSSFSNGTPDTVTVDSTRALEQGMIIDFKRSGSDVSNAVDVTITNITSLTTFTCTISGTPAENDTIHYANGYGYGAQGLDTIIATSGTFQGIASASYYAWQANVTTNASTTRFSPKQLRILLTTIEKRLGGKTANLTIIVDPDLYDAMGWVLLGSRMITVEKSWEGYWRSFTWAGRTIVKDPDCPPNTLYIVHKEGIMIGVLGGELVNLVDDDGSSYRMALSSGAYVNSFNAHFDGYANLACLERIGHGKITNLGGLSDDVGYAADGGVAA